MSIELQVDKRGLKVRAKAIVPVAREMLAGTAFLESDLKFTTETEEVARNLMIASAPFSHQNAYPDFIRHSLTVAIYLKKAAEKLDRSDLSPSKAFCIGLLHDWPPVAPHRYLRKNIAAGLILGNGNIGIREDVLAKFPEVLSILQMRGRMGRNTLDFLRRGNIQIVGDAIDNIARVAPDGKVRDPYEFIRELEAKSKNRSSGYLKSAIWPSEKKGLAAMYSRGTNRSQFAINLVKWELAYLKRVKGLNIETLRREVEREYNSPENQSFIIGFLNAQETLDPEVDRKLGREPITTIVFDVGGVFLNVRDEELISNISSKLKVSQDLVTQAFEELNPEAFAGRISNEEYLAKFAQIVGVDAVSQEDFVFPEIYHSMQGMQEIVENLRQNGIDIWIYSNIIPLLTAVARQKLFEFFPKLDPQKILYSCDIKAKKQDIESFKTVAGTIGAKGILFIDDLEKYTTNARVSGAMRGFTFRGNPYREISPQQRLISELKLAGFYPKS